MSSTGAERVLKAEQRHFYITGLPRSRTSWLSVAMSDWRVSACLHEPLAQMTYTADVTAEYASSPHLAVVTESTIRMADVHAALASTRCPFAGIADTGLAIVAPDLPEVLPGPVLVVWRDPEEVIDSLVEYFGGDREAHAGGVALMQVRLEEFARRCAGSGNLMNAYFESLSDAAAMRSIWSHLLPGVPFQRRRIESLQRLRIDPVPDQLLDGLTDSARAAALSAMK